MFGIALLSIVLVLAMAPVAYRILAPLSKPRAHETGELIAEMEAAARR